MWSAFTNKMWPVVQFYFSKMSRDSWNLDTKFCLHATGGIFVQKSFANSGGEIQISGSSAEENGGAVRRSSSWVFGTILGWAVGPVRSTLGSENRKEWKRFR